MRFETKAIHAGQEPEPAHGAVNVPIYQTSTYAQEEAGKPRTYEYARTGNPTRTALEEALGAVRVTGARVLVCAGLAGLLLRVRGGLVDRHVDGAVGRLGLLSRVDRLRLEPHASSSRNRSHPRRSRSARAWDGSDSWRRTHEVRDEGDPRGTGARAGPRRRRRPECPDLHVRAGGGRRARRHDTRAGNPTRTAPSASSSAVRVGFRCARLPVCGACQPPARTWRSGEWHVEAPWAGSGSCPAWIAFVSNLMRPPPGIGAIPGAPGRPAPPRLRGPTWSAWDGSDSWRRTHEVRDEGDPRGTGAPSRPTAPSTCRSTRPPRTRRRRPASPAHTSTRAPGTQHGPRWRRRSARSVLGSRCARARAGLAGLLLRVRGGLVVSARWARAVGRLGLLFSRRRLPSRTSCVLLQESEPSQARADLERLGWLRFLEEDA